ncbi:fungal-specific transcription factor domain-containing protein [Penicillium canescens]|uniref:Fungal-specific transcription factor domain-containing protein n=1 Tax=Penicillium canescens TaxID=5083 RepID=A0AAD6N4J1_PENCN|nr:fungal-specific transcription factor domain-containing protein [Penicillium canescens]KAJ6029951.1 fungal-specific transcription factor domain-containing protein [Penicillium canescens]KAJ6060329.1 fungal-specific transcription factor domain-containing protein [Penicillium canescens]KAJ6078050.1 fungal-specific transcription factor domain-containing protein [Penicillium canescens]
MDSTRASLSSVRSIRFSPITNSSHWSEYSNDLYGYYCERVCQSMTLVDDSSNAFRRVVLPLALQNPIVLNMVFALGALSLAHTGRNKFLSIALHYKVQTIRLLRHNISHPTSALNDFNLIVVVMLCVFEASDSEDITWSIHLCAAVDMLKANIRTKMFAFSPEVLKFVAQFFIAKEALGGTACGKRGKVKNFTIPRSAEVDPSLGCSLELVDLISQITDLSMTLEFAHACETRDEKMDFLWRRLESLIQYSPPEILLEPSEWLNEEGQHQQGDKAAQNWPGTILHQTSLLMHVVAKLYFLACLRPMNPDQPQVQKLVQDAIALLKPLSPCLLHPAHLWPLFVCAVYAVVDANRVFFLDQFDLLRGHSNIYFVTKSIKKAREVVELVWKRRDIHQVPSFRCEWVEEVQPMIRGLCFR